MGKFITYSTRFFHVVSKAFDSGLAMELSAGSEQAFRGIASLLLQLLPCWEHPMRCMAGSLVEKSLSLIILEQSADGTN